MVATIVMTWSLTNQCLEQGLREAYKTSHIRYHWSHFVNFPHPDILFKRGPRVLAPMQHPCQRDEFGNLRLGEHRDGPHHHLRPHHAGLVPQNSFAMEGPALHGLVCKHKVGAEKEIGE